jgi:predicted MFS family arabinose efflux permease
MLARVGVGIGEASVTPASWSLLADYFPADRLARPMSVFLMGPYLGAGLALILGAEVIEWTRDVEELSLPLIGSLAAWQFTFIAVGVPGFIVAAVLATIKEPARISDSSTELADHLPWSDVWLQLRNNRRVYAALLLGAPFIVVILYGLQAWIPTYLVRVFDWDLARSGRVYGVIALVAGSSGVLSGPVLGNWLKRRGFADYPLRIGVIGALLAMIGILGIPWMQQAEFALCFIALASFSVTLPMALFSFALQTVTPGNMRGLVAGLYVVTVNVVGLALGPTLVALSTDYIFADPKAVGYSMALVSGFMAPLAILLLSSGMKPYAELFANQGDAEN